jgi:hypothetical protein
MTIVGPVLNMVVVSHDEEGAPFWIWLSYISFLLRLFTVPVEPSRFATMLVTTRGYKVGGRSCTTYILSHDLSSSPRLLPYD